MRAEARNFEPLLAEISSDGVVDSLSWLDLTLSCERELGLTLPAAVPDTPVTAKQLAEMATAAPAWCGSDPIADPESILSVEQLKLLKPPSALRLLQPPLYALNYLMMKLCFRVQSEGMEKVPLEEPLLFCPNHLSFLDAFLIGAVLPYGVLRRNYWVALEGLAFGGCLQKLFSRTAQLIPADGEQATRQTLALAATQLKRGGSLGLFPEGERAHPDAAGELLPLKAGVGRLLAIYPRTVVPIYVEGSNQAWPTDRRYPLPAKVTIHFLEPVHSSILEREGKGTTTAQKITVALEQRMRKQQ